ncbi:MAG: class I adenylate-forming enzyme family protein [Desulfitobacterium hafniense]|nr:class I adenylate-forming enzyme family protein [Desulfitobacterium hafniense]
MATVGQFLNNVCERFPEQNVLNDYDRKQKWTYRQWSLDSQQLVRELSSMSLEAGDFVMTRFGNDYGYLVAYGGVARAEGVIAPIGLRMTRKELGRLLALVKPKWFLTSASEWEEIEETVRQSSIVKIGIYTEGTWTWSDNTPFYPARKPDHSLAHLRFTSGSQGEPKIVALTHYNMIYRVGNFKHYAQEGDVFYLSIPFVFRPDRLIQAFSVGGEIVVADTVYPEQLVRIWQEEKVTFAWLVPTIIGLLIQLTPEQIPENLLLRGINTGGAYLYRHWEEKFEQLFGVPVYQQYGLSEGCVAFENPIEKRSGSVGKPTPSVQVRICDPDGKEVPAGEIGELWYQGDNIMQGYLDRPDLTADTLKDGWLRTGDMARFDKEGYLFIEGRLKDLIHSGGLKFSPREVEEVILIYPGVQEVSVVPVSHKTKGEIAKAYFVADRLIRGSELRAFCRKYLADYKIPRQWKQVETLPKLASGKVAKRSVGQQN